MLFVPLVKCITFSPLDLKFDPKLIISTFAKIYGESLPLKKKILRGLLHNSAILISKHYFITTAQLFYLICSVVFLPRFQSIIFSPRMDGLHYIYIIHNCY